MEAIERNLKGAGKTHREGGKRKIEGLRTERAEEGGAKENEKKKRKRDYLGRGESGGREKPVVI